MQQAFGPGSRKPGRIAGQYPGGVREFLEGGPRLWNSRKDLTDAEAAGLWSFSLGEAEARLEYAEKVGWEVLTPGCPKYPKLLAHIPNPPAVLYGKGELPDLDRTLSVAVVGARKPLPVTEEAAGSFGYQLALAGACVVSGGAKGVDAAALTGAMRAPGAKLVSVLPVSLDGGSPQMNFRLRQAILERGGALLTEYFSQKSPVHGTFPLRNRLITGLSRGVVILQTAGKGSGGMLYAASALEQDRDVFVYPGPEGAEEFAGSRKLLAEGAKAVTSGEDVLAEYGGPERKAPARKVPAGKAPLKPKGPEERESSPELDALFAQMVLGPGGENPAPGLRLEDVGAGLAPAARRVWEALGPEPRSVLQLEEATGMEASALFGVLTELELDGLARSYPGKRYARA